MIFNHIYKKLGLIGRLAFAVALFILLGAMSVFYLQTAFNIKKEKERLSNTLEENSSLILPILVNSTIAKDFSTVHALLDTQVKVRKDVYKLEWTYNNGISIVSTSGQEKSQVPPWFLAINDISDNYKRHYNAKAYGFNGEFIVSISQVSMQNEIWKQFLSLMNTVLAVTSLVTLAIILILRSNLKTIQSFASISNAIRNGDFSARINAVGAPELKNAALAFNEMASSTESLLTVLEVNKKELSAQLSFTRQLLDAIPNPVCYINPDAQLLGANQAWEHFFDINVNTVYGKKSFEIYHFDPSFAQAMHQSDLEVIANQQKQFFGISLTDKSDKNRCVMISKACFKNPENGAGGVIATIVDVTDLENALQDKSVAEAASEAKSHFLANMSHEMRTPLTAIIGLAESMYDKERGPEKQHESLNTIIRAGKHLLQLINDLLDLSKVEAGKLEIENIPTNLLEVIEEVTEYTCPHAKAKHLGYEVEYSLPLPEIIITDPLRLKQILINLLNNAIKFTEKGYVKLFVNYDKSNSLNFSVIDSGIGISDEQARRLFAPFSKADSSTCRKFGGTGLGLYLSKILAEKLGGALEMKSELGKGSQFIVSLPGKKVANSKLINELPDLKAMKNTDTATIKKLSGKVLLVEDNVDNQEFIEHLLNKAGLSVEIASNGEQAVERVSKYPYDMILMDMQMPVLDGLQAAKKMRQLGVETTMIALTANAAAEDKRQCLDTGYNDFLVKPVDQAVFYKTLEKYLPESEIHGTDAAITSSLLSEHDRFLKLVTRFVKQLPSMIQEIDDAYTQNNYDVLHAKVHNLKGVGGNMGFQILTDIATIMESNIKAGSMDKLPEGLEALHDACQRIQAGITTQSTDNKSS